MSLWNRIVRWWAIRGYVKRLGRRLAARYRPARYYRYSQVRDELATGRYNQDYSMYAYAMYLHRREYSRYQEQTGSAPVDVHDYHTLREEVAQDFNGGSTDFHFSTDTTSTTVHHGDHGAHDDTGHDSSDGGWGGDGGGGDSGGGGGD
jgi:hypothetical protein